MDTLLVMQIVALAAVTGLCLFLIVVLVRVRNFLMVVEHDVKKLSARAIPVLENLEVITDKVKNIAESIDGQVDVLKNAITSVKGVIDNMVDFECRIQERIEEPVLETIGTFAAVFNGVKAFIARLRA
ncbi:MAG: hypothetical protein HYR76_05445 [Ignavibacteria bacterium]|nr:hypothetical protein [Ignavibacteria bacterium]MBI3766069.1 hypothetical protein [Ignavibacteriales bacterium]